MDLPFAKAQLRCGRLPDRARGDVGRPRFELPVRKRPRPLRAAMRFCAAGAMDAPAGRPTWAGAAGPSCPGALGERCALGERLPSAS